MKISNEYLANTFQKTILVDDGQTDAFGRMSPGALAMCIGDATTEHMRSLGVSAEALYEHGLAFVLARTSLEVAHLPKKGEQVHLLSWAGAEKHWMYPRRAVMLSPAGERLVSACSQWMLIDASTRTLSPPSEVIGTIPVLSLTDEPKTSAFSMKFPTEFPGQAERVVQPHEIDINGHMNNSHYLNWASNLVDSEYLDNHALRSLWVEYCKELFEGQRVRLCYAQEDDNLFVRGYIDRNESFSVKMEFDPIKRCPYVSTVNT